LNYIKFTNRSYWNPDIGVICISGNIDKQLTQSICKSIRESRDNASIKALVLRINSGGGSAIGSSEIWAEVIRTRAYGKPVIVSMGDVAASGGYYIACAGDTIVAQPGTITGSIGVVFGKLSVSEIMSKIGIGYEGIASDHPDKVISLNKSSNSWNKSEDERSPAFLLSIALPFNKNDLQIINNLVQNDYQIFKSVVSTGRNIPIEQVEELAQGKVYTGLEAHQLGLVDKLGGFQEALDIARSKIGNPRATASLVSPSYWEKMLKYYKNFLTINSAISDAASVSSEISKVLSQDIDVNELLKYESDVKYK